MSAHQEIQRLKESCASLAADMEQHRKRALDDRVQGLLEQHKFVDVDARNAFLGVVLHKIKNGTAPDVVIAEALVQYSALLKPPDKPAAVKEQRQPAGGAFDLDQIRVGMSPADERRAADALFAVLAPKTPRAEIDSGSGLTLEQIKPGMSLEEQRRAAGELLKYVKR